MARKRRLPSATNLKHSLLGATIISSLIVLVLILYRIQNPQAIGTPSAADDILKVSGRNLVYRGQNVILRGTNINNLEALKAEWGEGSGQWIWTSSAKITDIRSDESDYAKISELGGNHVRFGISYSWYRENKSQFFQVMDQHVAWARKHNLWIVPNLFTTPGDCYEGYSAYCDIHVSSSEQDQLRTFWRDMADHYKNEPVIAGYDVLNEPLGRAESGWAKGWHSLMQSVVDEIRKVDTSHAIFYMATADSGFFHGKLNDSNIVYEAHDYAPLGMSHCGTSANKVTYPGDSGGVYWSKDSQLNGSALKSKIQAIQWTMDNNVPLYIGEWGPQSNCLTGREQYSQDKGDIYRTWGIHQAHFVWAGGSTHWGLFSHDNVSTPNSTGMLTAVKNSWAGSIRPDFSGTSPAQTPTSTVAPTTQPTSAPTQTASPTVMPSASPTPTSTTTPPNTSGGGLLGQYYSGSRADASNLKLTRGDAQASFNWGSGSPDSSLASDAFFVRWTGEVLAPVSGWYKFVTRSDDGVILYVAEKLLIWDWSTGATREKSASVYLDANKWYPIRLDYFENTGNALIELRWQVPGKSQEVIPTSSLRSSPAPTPTASATPKPSVTPQPTVAPTASPLPAPETNGLTGVYYNNTNFTSLAFARVDQTINFNWHVLSPDASRVNPDTFSIEWNGFVSAPYSGRYTFYTQADDGVRLWLDNKLIIDNWKVQSFTEKWASVDMDAGRKYAIKIQYFENTGLAAVKLWWQHPSIAKQIVPSKYLFTK